MMYLNNLAGVLPLPVFSSAVIYLASPERRTAVCSRSQPPPIGFAGSPIGNSCRAHRRAAKAVQVGCRLGTDGPRPWNTEGGRKKTRRRVSAAEMEEEQ